MVTVAAEDARDDRAKAAFFIVEPNREQLIEIANRLGAGELRAVVDRAVPFSQGRDAYLGKIERQGRGKVVVLVVAD
jgi:NADPH:quinone reductase-like Zn-dependent oxidoreductase